MINLLNKTFANDISNGNTVNLCDSCQNRQPTCSPNNLIFGQGKGNDNICACGAYVPLKTNYWVVDKNEAPLINPLAIPIDWWGIAMEPIRIWNMHHHKPDLMDGGWSGSFIPIKGPESWKGDWEKSAFSRIEIKKRWIAEYGERWREVAEIDA